ncbi:MAG: hypothetical protein RLZZ437_602 [Pseudomonadota bacterium]|jgi:hypothetical protein
MANKPTIKRPEVKKRGFYDDYVEALIDGMPVLLSKNSALWLKKMSDEHQQEQIDEAIELWGNRPPR